MLETDGTQIKGNTLFIYTNITYMQDGVPRGCDLMGRDLSLLGPREQMKFHAIFADNYE